MIAPTEKKTYTPEEYLEFEITSEERHEYRNGNIIPMTGGTPNHNELLISLAGFLNLSLRGKPYRVFAADQRLWIPERNIYTYPDVMVVEKPLQLQTGRTDTVINPCLIAEVLSKSTQDYDRSEKFLAYRTMDSFREYLIIDQYNIHVEHFLKTGSKQWLLSEYTDENTTVYLNQFDLDIKIAELYENVIFRES